MKYSTLLLLLTLSINLFGQKVVVSTKATKMAYCGYENPIEVLVEGYNNKPFTVKIDSGELKKVDKYNYLITPKTRGPIRLFVYNANGKIIYKDSIKVVNGPKPLVVVGGMTGGEMDIRRFKANIDFDNEEIYGKGAKGMVQISFFCYDPTEFYTYKITDYTVRVISGNKDTVSYKVTNNQFNPTTKKALESTKVGDKVIFDSIKAVSKCGLIMELGSMEFILNK